MNKKRLKKLLEELEDRIEDLELEVFGGTTIKFEPDPYLLDPNKEVREEIMQNLMQQQLDTSVEEFKPGHSSLGHSAAEGGEVGQQLKAVGITDIEALEVELAIRGFIGSPEEFQKKLRELRDKNGK